MVEFQPPRGTRDFGPDEMKRRRWAEGLMRAVIESYGYTEVATPTFEASDLFISRSGPQVVEQMYLFMDKGGREMVLRPELTAPVMRFYTSSLKNMPKPLRIYYFGNCFRYERPQKGRYREFWQMGLEYIGKRTPLAHAEVISAALGALQKVGIPDLRFRIGHVTILRSILKGLGLDPDNDKDLMISIDKKDTKAIEARLSHLGGDVADKVSSLVTTVYSPEMLETVITEIRGLSGPDLSVAFDDLRLLFKVLECFKGTVLFDPSISRGLDYYDGIVFEADVPSLGAEKQVCGGGAYSMSSIFGTEVEGIGFGLGFDRILVSLERTSPMKAKDGGFYIVPIGDAALKAAFDASLTIRSKGLRCIMETMDRPLKRAISSAVDQGCAYLLIIGGEEVREGRCALKDLHTQHQRDVPMIELSSVLDEITALTS